MKILICTSVALAMISSPATQTLAAQVSATTTGSAQASAPAASAPAPLQVQTRKQANAKLPANTEVLLKMNQEVTTKGKTWSEGDTFALSVVHDVLVGDYVVIPAGSRATGRITWLTNKGMFGKSGKMDIELEYVTVNGRRIDLEGTYRQEGEGNTVATVAGVVAVPIAGLFITGRSGRIPQGREMMATTERDIELAIPASAVSQGVAPLAPSAAPQTGPMPVEPASASAAAPAEPDEPMAEEAAEGVSEETTQS